MYRKLLDSHKINVSLACFHFENFADLFLSRLNSFFHHSYNALNNNVNVVEMDLFQLGNNIIKEFFVTELK